MSGWAGCEIRREKTVDSTNLAARRWAKDGAPHGAVVVAEMQTAGRGRRGREWSTSPGMGLWLSIVLRPKIPVESYPLLPLLVALAGAEACEQVTGADVRIKWPNDLVLSGRKITGILAEREGDAVVVGIGINVRQRAEDFPSELREKAGSLEMLTGQMVSLDALEAALLARIEHHADRMDFLTAYEARCATIGARVCVVETLQTFEGTAEGLDPMGALLVRDDEDTLRRVLAADVSVRGMMGYV